MTETAYEIHLPDATSMEFYLLPSPQSGASCIVTYEWTCETTINDRDEKE